MESRTIGESVDKRFLVCCQFRFPAILTDYHSQPNCACVRHELGEIRSNPVGRPIESINQTTCLLELDREEVSCRDVFSTPLDTVLVRTTLDYLIAPEVEAGFIRFTTKEVDVVLSHKILRSIQWVLSALSANC